MVLCPVDLHCTTASLTRPPSHHSNSNSQSLSSLDALAGDQQLIQLLTANSPAWQSLSGDTSSQLLLHLVMLIERQAGLAEVLPWLWPLADEDSGCTVHAAPSLQTRLLAALIAVPEGMDNALGGKVSLVDMLHAKLLLLAESVSFGIAAESRPCSHNVLLYSCTTMVVWKAVGTSKLVPIMHDSIKSSCVQVALLLSTLQVVWSLPDQAELLSSPTDSGRSRVQAKSQKESNPRWAARPYSASLRPHRC